MGHEHAMQLTTQQSQIRNFRHQSGVSLVEVLVTVVVIAIGLLGIAAMQVLAKQTTYDASERSIAVQLANSLLERMRANPQGLETYGGNASAPIGTFGTSGTYFNGSAPSPSSCTVSAICSTNQLAVVDLWDWEQKLLGATQQLNGVNTGGLVSPTACIYTDVAAGLANRSGRYTIAIAWRGKVEMANPQNPNPPAAGYDPYTCGQGTGLYNGNSADSYRRILVVDTYVAG
jgi:type IV pilus assembly protein PilV